MRRNRFWLAGLAACLALALAGFADHKPSHTRGGGGDDGGKGGNITPVPVIVTFRDAFPLGGAPVDRIGSDCNEGKGSSYLCPYDDGVDEVQAVLLSRYLLTVDGWVRQFFVDLSDCRSSPNVCNLPKPFTSSKTGWATIQVSTKRINKESLLDLGKGEMKSMIMGFAFNLPGQSPNIGSAWGVNFGGVLTVKECKGSSLVTAKRTGDTSTGDEQDTWEIEAGPNALACLTLPASEEGEQFRGLYRMPFQLTVQIK